MRINYLESKVSILKRLTVSEELFYAKNSRYKSYFIKKENQEHKKELKEIKSFLKDCGLHCKGNKQNSEGKLKRTTRSTVKG